ncbi:hypothetical protein [Herbaspirillum huttiense]|uniref:Uncharacterized protein n=2 Tax=Herbaspirillum huttiense TaxID=863372 RepID=A0AAJ2HC93_9BURK|nr:hypothetical protein [Herbaspirillum huttiense]MDR9839408.1 hypothetical protein [Herbaspirillum huttiense]
MSIKYQDPLCEMAFADWFYENYGLSQGGRAQSIAKAAWEFAASVSRAQPKEEMQPVAWSDMKVAFDVEDDDALWSARDAGKLVLPKGWNLIETDGSGARWVAIFRVEHAPTIEEGARVRSAIDAALAAKDKP